MSRDEETLDPQDWEATRALAHRVVDDAVDYLRDVRERPLWQPMPAATRDAFRTPLPEHGSSLDTVYAEVVEHLMPYPMGNVHPRFWMWFMGSSNFTGALADFLAAIIGSNVGGGDHAAAALDRQVVRWCAQMVGFPAEAGGTLTSGGTVANLIGLAVARHARAGHDVRVEGLGASGARMRFYGSEQLHSCHQKALEVMGLGQRALRKVATDADYRMDLAALADAVAEDRAAGLQPLCVIASAGTVNSGAIDDLEAIGGFCRREGLWFHVDGCIGALIAIAPRSRALVAGIEHADSLALDPHKWLHAPFEVGCALVRDARAHLDTFTLTPEYLRGAERGIAAAEMLHDYGVQTSRGFRALKVWLALKEHGVRKFGRLIDQNIAQAASLAERVAQTPSLEMVAPAPINIVCFRFNPGGCDEQALAAMNREIMLRLQESGVAAVSDTTLDGRHCLRAAITNHRTRRDDLDVLIAEVLRHGAALARA